MFRYFVTLLTAAIFQVTTSSAVKASDVFIAASPNSVPLDVSQSYPVVAYRLENGSLLRLVGVSTRFEGSVWAGVSPSGHDFVSLAPDVGVTRVAYVARRDPANPMRFEVPVETIGCALRVYWVPTEIAYDLLLVTGCADRRSRRNIDSQKQPSSFQVNYTYTLVDLAAQTSSVVDNEVFREVLFRQTQNAQPSSQPSSLVLNVIGDQLILQVPFDEVPLRDVPVSTEFLEWANEADSISMIGATLRHVVARRFASVSDSSSEADSDVCSLAVFDRTTRQWLFFEEDAWLSPSIVGEWLVLEKRDRVDKPTSAGGDDGVDEDQPVVAAPGVSEARYSTLSTRGNPKFEASGQFKLVKLPSGAATYLRTDEADSVVLSISTDSIVVREGSRIVRYENSGELRTADAAVLADNPEVRGIHYALWN